MTADSTVGVPSRAAVSLRALRKRYGRLEVLRGVDLDIAEGRITAIVGPNAAGKTTLIKSILGLVRRRDGVIRVGGETVGLDPSYRRGIGYMPQAARFPEQLTGTEVLALLRGVRGEAAERDERLIDQLELRASLPTPVAAMSGGTRQKLNAAVAFLFRPKLLILDEPTAGLDPVASAVLKDRIKAAPGEGQTVILTSHIMSEIQELADLVVFLVEGSIRFQGSIASLVERTGEDRLERAVARMMRES
ncbi:MAG: ABC transporter ATP-binding protein [Gemmatimonadales bacterium]